MGRKLPSLNAMRTFEAAARLLSFTEAANELCVTQAAVSRQVRLLEEELDVKLFRRMTRAIELTEEGTLLYLPVHDALDQMERAAARIWSRSGGGLLTISVLPTFSVKWLMPRLLHFSELHPAIEVHLVNSINPADFDREEIDLAIRVGTVETNPDEHNQPRIDLAMVKSWDGLQAEMLMTDELVAVISPAYPGFNRPYDHPSQIEGVPLLQMATRQNAWPDYFKALGWSIPDPRKGQSFGHFFMALQAAIEGKGIALLPSVLLEDDLRDGRVVPAISNIVRSVGGYHLIGRKSQWDRQKVSIFRSWLKNEVDDFFKTDKT